MNCTYTVHWFPVTSIACNVHPQKGEKNHLKIAENTFSSIPCALRIRPKAAVFIQYNFYYEYLPAYAITYQDEKNTECLFVFTIIPPRTHFQNFRIVIARCVGKRIVKKHWKKVNLYLKENITTLATLLPGQSISFH